MVEIETANQLEHLRDLLRSGGDISIAVAYLTRSGLEQIRKELSETMSKGHEVRMVVDLSSGITEPDTLRKMVGWCRNNETKFRFRAFFSTRGQAIFHGKVYIAHSRNKEFITFLTGSYNLTQAALTHNLEHGLLVKCNWHDDVGQQTLIEFKKIWENPLARTLDDKAISLYGEFRDEAGGKRENAGKIQKARETLQNYLQQSSNPAGSGYWLIKCNISQPYVTDPERKFYRFSDLLSATDQTDYWGNEVVNKQARNYLEKYMKEGDEALFFHSGFERPEAVGVVRVVRNAYQRSNASGKKGVDIKATQKFLTPVTLKDIKGTFPLEEMILVRGSTRLSIQPVRKEEWEEILKMGNPKPVSKE